MKKIKIGYDAGKVWQVLNIEESIKISDLKKATKMDIKDIYLALGWLARESKINFFELENEFTVCLAHKTE